MRWLALEHEKGLFERHIGVFDDDNVRNLLADPEMDLESEVELEWYLISEILDAEGTTAAATTLRVADATCAITLQHWPRQYDYQQLAFRYSKPGQFVSVFQSQEGGS